MSVGAKSAGVAPTIVRAIGRWDLVALMINVTIGAGILGLPARIFALAGPYSVLVLIACAVLVGVIALCFAEVGSRFSDSGGPYLMARTAFGPTTGFLVGALYWISRVLTFATICNLLAVYAARLHPALATEMARIVVIASLAGAITTVHLMGVRHATVAGNALTALKVLLLGGFGVLGLLSVGAPVASAAPAPEVRELADAVLITIFAFVGFEAAFVSTGETREPKRDWPFAVGMALAAVLTLYVLVQVVCMVGVPDLAASAAPVADAAVTLWGGAAERVVIIGAVIVMLGSLNAGFLATTRLPFAFAEQGDAPRSLARVHARFRTPHIAVALSGALVLIATLSSSFLSAVTLATSTRVIVYIAGCAALIVFRRRASAPPAGFKAPGGVILAAVAIALSLALLASASSGELIQLLLAAALTLLVYRAGRSRSH